ncbi:hypothetical protein B484DRAFT_400440 [Ochromonadaceae sp. CCMP2298]|nr:hypothetical protein B484DRAFT_400440 [Ochromonadaceae sp. CCMP2298]|mmetsp:Transcript_5604/g.12791  ORF Transcript_5604/g.12791 Transcript_5604/m.12791 type:complete len:293 (+) Transcript_5604:995-1873(+)
MKGVKFFHLRGVSIFDQLCFEELLLRTTTDNVVVINHKIPSSSIVLGFSGKPHELLHLDAVKRDSVEVIRRFTGGGTVVVDPSTVFVSFIFNSSDTGCNPYPREIMQWTADKVYGPLFQGLCTADAAGAAGTVGTGSSEFGLRENDYVWGDKKIGGNAQTITKGRWVHHTSFLWHFDPAMMGYLQLPSKRPAYRNDRPHTDFLAQVSAVLPPSRSSPEHFCAQLHRQLGCVFPEVQLAMDAMGAGSGDSGQLVGPGAAMTPAMFSAVHAASKLASPDFKPRTYFMDGVKLFE